ncbi:MAG TPA: cyclic nucleotide-binding domain-containing protein [Verrucomicrobiae bacterium]|nr:cyclic nucleotide-binding domain-containing protein [Verrucomicrobiae bacterium]
MRNLRHTTGCLDETGSPPTVEQVIASHPFLQGLKPEHLEALAAVAVRARFAPGQVLFNEGDPANRFYLIESGKIAIESRREGATSARIQVLGAGEALGWSWLFPPYYWHFDARALEDTSAIFFYGPQLREQCELDSDLGYSLVKRMAAVMIRRIQFTRAQLIAAIG